MISHAVFAAFGLICLLCFLLFYIYCLTEKLSALKKETHTNRFIQYDNQIIIETLLNKNETLTEKMALYEKQTQTNRLIQHDNQIIIETLVKRNKTLTEKMALYEEWRVQYTEYMKKTKAHYTDIVNKIDAQNAKNMKILLRL